MSSPQFQFSRLIYELPEDGLLSSALETYLRDSCIENLSVAIPIYINFAGALRFGKFYSTACELFAIKAGVLKIERRKVTRKPILQNTGTAISRYRW